MKTWVSMVVALVFAHVLGACNSGFLRDEPPQPPVPEKTPRIMPGDSKADAKIALEKIAAERFAHLQEIGGELRVVRRSNEHIWACNAWIAMTGTGRTFVVATAEMSGEVGGNNMQGASLGFKPLPPGTAPTTGECESKLQHEFPDIETSVLDRLLP